MCIDQGYWGIHSVYSNIVLVKDSQRKFFVLGKGKTGEAKTEGREIKGKTGCKGREIGRAHV